MNNNKKREPHPIVKKALEMAHTGFEPIEFDDYALEQIEGLLRECFGKPELYNAVIDLINLAGILEEGGSASASMKLIIIVSKAADELKKLKKL